MKQNLRALKEQNPCNMMRGMIRAQRRIYAEWARGREGTLKEKMLAVTADALVAGADIAKLCSGRGSPSSGDWSTARP